MFLIMDSGKLAGHDVHSYTAKIWVGGFFMETFCPGKIYTKSRATTGLSSCYTIKLSVIIVF